MYPIGIFDSGYGGLTILRQIQQYLPQYDYLYLGDNARAPYGPHSFESIYRYTQEAVEELFRRGCRLVILACNTASAKALRTIKQVDIPRIDPNRRVLGVIRPTVEAVQSLTKTGHVGVLGTPGTVNSGSYKLEICRLSSYIEITQVACPMWVPLVEYGEYDSPGADFFVRKRIEQIMHLDPKIDTLVLACTHYPLLINKILKYTPTNVRIVEQGEYVAKSLADYLKRHPEIDAQCSKGGLTHYLTTENASKFSEAAAIFMHQHNLRVEEIELKSCK